MTDRFEPPKLPIRFIAEDLFTSEDEPFIENTDFLFDFEFISTSDSFTKHTPHFAIPGVAGEVTQSLGSKNDRMSMKLFLDDRAFNVVKAFIFYETVHNYSGIWSVRHPIIGDFYCYITKLTRVQNFVKNRGATVFDIEVTRDRVGSGDNVDVANRFSNLSEQFNTVIRNDLIFDEIDAGIWKTGLIKGLGDLEFTLFENSLIRDYIAEASDVVLHISDRIHDAAFLVEVLDDVTDDPSLFVEGLLVVTGLYGLVTNVSDLDDGLSRLGDAVLDLFNLTLEDAILRGERPIGRGELDFIDAFGIGVAVNSTRAISRLDFDTNEEILDAVVELRRLRDRYVRFIDDIQLVGNYNINERVSVRYSDRVSEDDDGNLVSEEVRELLSSSGESIEDGDVENVGSLNDIRNGRLQMHNLVLEYMSLGIEFLRESAAAGEGILSVRGNGIKSSLQLYLETSVDRNEGRYDRYLARNDIHGIDILSVPDGKFLQVF